MLSSTTQQIPPKTVTSNTGESVQEYSIRVPKNGRKKFHLMRFNATLNVDFAKWNNVKMERENNMKEYKGVDEELPKFGAGSEFGRDAREEARKKKLGFIAKKYKPEDQPWILKAGGKGGKKFKGIREGGVSENASYYVFTHAADGAIEAFPLQEWYNFTPIQTYKALSAEEAEQEFGKRNRVLNYFSLMMRKRLRGDEDVDGDDGVGGSDEIKKSKTSKKDKELKISEMDEWMDTSSSDDNSGDETNKEKKDSDEEKNNKKNGKTKEAAKKKKKQRDTDAEAFEDSDDGDDEGRELDYISSSSESEVEAEKQLQGVSEEKALRKLLTSDEDSEDEEQKSSKENSHEEEDDEEKDKKSKEEKDDENKKKKKSLKKKDSKKKKDKKDSSSDFSSDSESDPELKKKKEAKKEEKESTIKNEIKETNSATSSRSPSPTVTGEKRKLIANDNLPTKKSKLDLPGTSLPSYLAGSSDSGITEDAVRRYLMRKPMTTTELLQKFKTKKTGLSSEQLVNIMTQILKKINPIKQTIKGKMYLSIKA